MRPPRLFRSGRSSGRTRGLPARPHGPLSGRPAPALARPGAATARPAAPEVGALGPGGHRAGTPRVSPGKGADGRGWGRRGCQSALRGTGEPRRVPGGQGRQPGLAPQPRVRGDPCRARGPAVLHCQAGSGPGMCNSRGRGNLHHLFLH